MTGKEKGKQCNEILSHWMEVRLVNILGDFLQPTSVTSIVVYAWSALCNPMHCSLPGSPVHEVFQARILQWVAISFSMGSSWPRDQTHVSSVSCIAGGFFTCWAIKEEIHYKYNQKLKSDFQKKLIQGRNLEEDILLLEAESSLTMMANDVSSDQERSSSGVGLLQSLKKCLVWKKSYTKQILLDYTRLIQTFN